MEKTPTLQKIEKVIEKKINNYNSHEVEYVSPMGEDYMDIITVMYDNKTNLSEIDDEYIEKHNKIHKDYDRIPYGTKYYGTVYVKIVKIVTYDIDGEGETNIYPLKDDLVWGADMTLFEKIIDNLYTVLPRKLFDLDIDFTFKNDK